MVWGRERGRWGSGRRGSGDLMNEREKYLIRALDRELDDAEREEKTKLLQRWVKEGVLPEGDEIPNNQWFHGKIVIQNGVAGVEDEGIRVTYPVAHDVSGNIEPGRTCLAEITYRNHKWFVKTIKLPRPTEQVIAEWEKRFGHIS